MGISHDTKNQIANCLRQLMRKKNLTRISIVEICETCGINRRTFYYHFIDKLDLVCWFLLDELSQLGFQKERRHWSESCIMIFSEIKHNVDFYGNVLRSNDRERFIDFLYDISTQYFNIVICRMPRKYDPGFVEFACRFFTHSYVMTGVDWIEAGAPGSASELFDKLSACMEMDFGDLQL